MRLASLVAGLLVATSLHAQTPPSFSSAVVH